MDRPIKRGDRVRWTEGHNSSSGPRTLEGTVSRVQRTGRGLLHLRGVPIPYVWVKEYTGALMENTLELVED